ncbi:hypothetical protein [Streptosporangium sp. H16]|uniref:hypothetical protein n=1 Tax=Streptosporangium sp. H16 TaxID=3444184 RepID=UPI003F7A158F
MSIDRTTSQAPGLPGAHVIADDAEAVATARALAAEFAPGAAERDAGRLLPVPVPDIYFGGSSPAAGRVAARRSTSERSG